MRLLIGQRFTHRDFQDATASYRLSSYVESLRNRHNWPVLALEESGPTRDPTGREARYVRYLIEPDDLIELKKNMGERILKFIESVQKFEARAAATARTEKGIASKNAGLS
ncbi:MAG: hypothetical protein Kow0065_10320 [Methylomicrobium sp.]